MIIKITFLKNKMNHWLSIIQQIPNYSNRSKENEKFQMFRKTSNQTVDYKSRKRYIENHKRKFNNKPMKSQNKLITESNTVSKMKILKF